MRLTLLLILFALLFQGCGGPPTPEAFLQAVTSGDHQMVRSYIERGGSPEAFDGNTTALIKAAMAHDELMIQLLVSSGADVNRVVETNAGKTTALLTMAAQQGSSNTIMKLVNAGAEVNQMVDGKSPLTEAIIHNNKDAALWIIKKGHVDYSLFNNQNHPVIAAAQYGTDQIAYQLCLRLDLNNELGRRVVTVALEHPQLAYLKPLLNGGAPANLLGENGLPLLYKTFTLNLEEPAISFIKDYGVNTLDGDGYQVLGAALIYGHKDIGEPILKAIMEFEGDLNVAGVNKPHPVLLAMQYGKFEAFKYLMSNDHVKDHVEDAYAPILDHALKAGPDFALWTIEHTTKFKTVNSEGKTLLEVAAAINARPDVVRALVYGGADVLRTSDQGLTLSQIAKNAGHTDLAVLFSRLAQREQAKVVDEKTEQVIVRMVADSSTYKVDELIFNHPDPDHMGVLLVNLSAKKELLPLLDKVLRHNPDPSYFNAAGKTAVEMFACFASKDMMKKILDLKPDLSQHQLALSQALGSENYDAVQILLESGANPNLPTGEIAPLALAKASNADKWVDLLIKFGATPLQAP